MIRHVHPKPLAILMAAACFLSFTAGAVSGALAADAETFTSWPQKPAEAGVGTAAPKAAATDSGSFETWPKKTAEPGVAPSAEKAGEAAGQKTASGISAGTWGWIAAAGAAVIAVVLIAGSGGSSGGTTTTSNH